MFKASESMQNSTAEKYKSDALNGRINFLLARVYFDGLREYEKAKEHAERAKEFLKEH